MLVKVNATGEIGTLVSSERVGNAVFYRYVNKVVINGETRTYSSGQLTVIR